MIIPNLLSPDEVLSEYPQIKGVEKMEKLAVTAGKGECFWKRCDVRGNRYGDEGREQTITPEGYSIDKNSIFSALTTTVIWSHLAYICVWTKCKDAVNHAHAVNAIKLTHFISNTNST